MRKGINELGNIESCLMELKNQNNLINLLINGYFNRNKVEKKEEWELAWDYRVYQSLVFTISNNLRDIEDKLEDNVDVLFEKLKEAQNENDK